MNPNPPASGGIAGHGAFFQPTDLAPEDARKATAWVEKVIDKRSVELGGRMDDVRDHMWELEREGEIIVHRITDAHKPVVVRTLFGWENRGTGLGLAISWGIIEGHGGSINVASKVGEGTRFDIDLPLAPHAARLRDSNGPRPERNGRGRPLRGNHAMNRTGRIGRER